MLRSAADERHLCEVLSVRAANWQRRATIASWAPEVASSRRVSSRE